MHVARTHISVTVKYLLMTALAVVVYTYLMRLPQAAGVMSPASLWQTHGSIYRGLRSVWLIFAWGFGIQSLIQIVRVMERKPRDAGLTAMLKHGAWLSAHAGAFEEIIFRLYAFLSFIILLKFLNPYVGGTIEWAATHVILPVANFVTWNTFTPNFSAARRFVSRQITSHLDKEPSEVTTDDIPKLIEWTKATLALLTEDKSMVTEYAEKMSKLMVVR